MKNVEGKGEIARNDKLPFILTTREIVVCKLLLFETIQSLSPDRLGIGQSLRIVKYLCSIEVRSNEIPL